MATETQQNTSAPLTEAQPRVERVVMPEPYIKPRKKLDNETTEQELARRLEEYIEYAHAVRRFADVAFYEELLRFVERHNSEGNVRPVGRG